MWQIIYGEKVGFEMLFLVAFWILEDGLFSIDNFINKKGGKHFIFKRIFISEINFLV